MIGGTEKAESPSKFAKRAVRYNEFGSNKRMLAEYCISAKIKAPPKTCLMFLIKKIPEWKTFNRQKSLVNEKPGTTTLLSYLNPCFLHRKDCSHQKLKQTQAKMSWCHLDS